MFPFSAGFSTAWLTIVTAAAWQHLYVRRRMVKSEAERDRYQQLVINHSANWRHAEEKVQCVVLMRKGEQSLPSLEGVKAKVEEGGNGMPGYKDILSDQEKADVVAYLKTL